MPGATRGMNLWRAFDLVTGDGLVVGGECLVGVCLRPQEYRSSAWTTGYGVARCMHGNKKGTLRDLDAFARVCGRVEFLRRTGLATYQFLEIRAVIQSGPERNLSDGLGTCPPRGRRDSWPPSSNPHDFFVVPCGEE